MKVSKRFRNFIIMSIVFLLLWNLFAELRIVPSYIVPTPRETFEKIYDLATDKSFWPHFYSTMIVVFIGLMGGALFGFCGGVVCGISKKLSSIFLPFVAGIQSIPLVAFAPLLLLVFGQSLLSRTLIVSFVTCFPIIAATTTGFSSEQRILRRLFLSLGASPMQTFFKLRLPLALPSFVGGLKSALPLAWVGALVAEFLGTDSGLGFLLQTGSAVFDTAMIFAVIVILAVFGMISFAAIEILDDVYVKRFRIEL